MKAIIVGFGRIANTIAHDKKIASVFKYASHAQALSAHPDFDWIGIVDPADGTTEAAAEWGIQVGQVEDFEDAEFATLAIPPGARLDIVKRLPNLKAVLIEKPVGDAEEFIEYCEGRGIDVTVNFWRRGVPFFQSMSEGTLIGKIQTVFCLYGNGLKNNGSHLIDFLHMLFGDVRSVTRIGECETLQSLGCSGPMDDVSATFVLEMDGFHIHCAPIDFNHYREVSVDIWGESGRLSIMNESLNVGLSLMQPHRGMERQQEVSSEPMASTQPDVEMAFYNLYTSIAEGESLSPISEAVKTEKVLKGIIG